MVKAELLHGAAKSSKPERNSGLGELFLSLFENVPFDDRASVRYGQICFELERIEQAIASLSAE